MAKSVERVCDWHSDCPKCDYKSTQDDYTCPNCGKDKIRAYVSIYKTDRNDLESHHTTYKCGICDQPDYRVMPSGTKCLRCGAQIASKFIKVSNYPAAPNGCFIATAAFRDFDHPRVIDLRQFRDVVLARSETGKRFTRWYYREGPKLAAIVEASPILRKLSVCILTPVAHVAAFISRPRRARGA